MCRGQEVIRRRHGQTGDGGIHLETVYAPGTNTRHGQTHNRRVYLEMFLSKQIYVSEVNEQSQAKS